jgi:tetratricopeptide (TPR) repeat protein
MHHIYRQIILLCLLLIPAIQEASGADTVTLLQITKNDSPADSRIFLHFSDLPAYRLEASGQRIDLIMRNVTFDQAFKILPEDRTIVMMEQQRDGEETILTFLLRRPPHKLDSSFLLPNKSSKESAARSNSRQLVLKILWEESKSVQSSVSILPNPAKPDSVQAPPVQGPLDRHKPPYQHEDDRDILSNSPYAPQISTPQRDINSDLESPRQAVAHFSAPLRGVIAAKQENEPVRLQIPLDYSEVSDSGPKNRTAIIKHPVGVLRVNPDQATASRVITSEYAGKWNRFLKKYETGVTIPAPLHYSLPPFPVLGLAQPEGMQSGGTVNYQEIIAQSQTEGWQQVASKLGESVNEIKNGENREEMLLLHGEALVRTGAFDKARNILTKLHKGLPGSTIGRIAQYLAVYSIAAAGKPYDAAYELSFMQQDSGISPLTPYLDLLQAEIALATDNIDKAEILPQEKGKPYHGQVRRLFDLRRADMLFSAGRTDEAFILYKTLTAADTPFSEGRLGEAFAPNQALSAHDEILADHPSSLAKYAAILYQKGDYQSALKQYINRLCMLRQSANITATTEKRPGCCWKTS